MLPMLRFGTLTPLFVWGLLGLASCSHGLKDGYFSKGDVRYRVAAPPAGWRQLKLSGNDLAYVSDDKAHSIAVNATCENHEDPPLEVLTQHLLLGFTDRENKQTETLMLDGREALRSRYVAKLDGIPVGLDMVVMKKDGCVHDFVYLSPVDRGDSQRPVFEQVLKAFHAERRP